MRRSLKNRRPATHPDPKGVYKATIVNRLRASAKTVLSEDRFIDAERVQHACVLGMVVPRAVASIVCTNEPSYRQIWLGPGAQCDDLASFLAYDIVSNFLNPTEADSPSRTDALLEVGETLYPASERARSLIDEHKALMRDPTTVQLSRYVQQIDSAFAMKRCVFALIVNAIVGGPILDRIAGGSCDGGGSAEPDNIHSLLQWLSSMEADFIRRYQAGLTINATLLRSHLFAEKDVHWIGWRSHC